MLQLDSPTISCCLSGDTFILHSEFMKAPGFVIFAQA